MANINGVGNNFISPQSVQTANARTTNAKTNLGTAADATNAVRLLAKATNEKGAYLRRLTVKPTNTNTATRQLLFRSPDEGATLYFIADSASPAFTQSTTTVSPTTDFGYTPAVPLFLEANDELWVASSVALTDGWIWDAQYEAL